MSIVTSGIIVLLATLILLFLQLEPGVFAILAHYGSGKFPRKKRALLTSFYMLGVETVSVCLFICALFITNVVFLHTLHPEDTIAVWLIIIVFIALAIVSFFCYYRRRSKNSSELFIPRKCAEALIQYASRADTRSDAFALGVLSGVLELPFSLPLYLVSALTIAELSVQWAPSLLLAFLFALAPLVPLIVIRIRFRLDYNLADIMRSRVQYKNLVRLILCLAYLAIAVLFITELFI